MESDRIGWRDAPVERQAARTAISYAARESIDAFL
jgi:hypothetical protein